MTNHQQLIETALRKFPKAKRIAVENFTFGCDKMDMATEMNLAQDTAAYKWNAHTVNAIRYVINNHVEETMAGAVKCRNRGFIFPKVSTLIPAPDELDS